MFSNFKKAFKNEEEIDGRVPKEIIRSLNEKLPKGFEYTNIGLGAYSAVPISSQINLELNIRIPDDLPDEFKPSNIEELMEFMYRTQRSLEAVSDGEGCIIVNGEKLKIKDEIIKFPLENKDVTEMNIYIKPEPFQPPFQVLIEDKNIKKIFLIQRQPYADMNKSLFKNVDNNILEVVYILDEINEKINFKFNINIEKSNNVKEIVEGLALYNSCLNHELKFQTIDFSKFVGSKKYDYSVIKKTLDFWKRILELEEKLNIEFRVEFPIKRDDTIWIEKLYRSFIEEKAYKQYVDVDKITLEGMDGLDKEDIINSSGGAFQMIQNTKLEIWGVKLDLYDCSGLFDFKINEIVLIDKLLNINEIILESDSEKGIYQSIRHFATKEEAYRYRECMDELENAKIITIE